MARYFWIEGGLSWRLNLEMMLANHQPNLFPFEYFSNLQNLMVLLITRGSMLTTLSRLRPLLVFAGVREEMVGLLMWAVESAMA